MKSIAHECRSYLKIGVLAEALACLLTASAITTFAQQAPMDQDSHAVEAVQVYVNDIPYPGRAVVYEDTTYVDLYEFTDEVYLCREAWHEETATAVFSGEGIEINVSDGASYICANGRYLWCENGVYADADHAYVPLRAAAKALGADVTWNADEFAAYVHTGTAPILAASEYYVEDEVLWLSRIIYAEAGIEPFSGQIAVGNVVLNRVRNKSFPDTIYGVIFDRTYGVQFTPTANGRIYCTPDEEAVIAAKICLEGYTVSEDILYFINAALATNFWVPQNCDYIMTISGHDFYS